MTKSHSVFSQYTDKLNDYHNDKEEENENIVKR